MSAVALALLLVLINGPGVDVPGLGYGSFSVSAYTDAESPAWGNITASGMETREGICACGPSYAFGTLFVLPDRVLVCEDRGGLITDGHLDIWCEDEVWMDEVWGRRWLPAVVVRRELE